MDIPIVVLGVGTNPVFPSVQAVDIKLAQAKLMPVVTATWPSKLNQPAHGD